MSFFLSPMLIFSRKQNLIYLYQRETNKVLFSFPAHNNTEKPHGDPLTLESWGPAPEGFLTLSPPDFISHDFRDEFYGNHFGSKAVIPGESYVREWGEFEEGQMGRVRFALGSVEAPPGFPDRAAWDRELLVHAGRPFDILTKGCIRMSNTDVEKLAYEWIKYFRTGIELKVLFIDK